MVKTVKAMIEGKVQGVWYRGWMEKTAREKNLAGWVRNLDNGQVEALLSGNPDDVEEMLDLCWQGPEPAIVTNVTAAEGETPDSPEFVVRRSL